MQNIQSLFFFKICGGNHHVSFNFLHPKLFSNFFKPYSSNAFWISCYFCLHLLGALYFASTPHTSVKSLYPFLADKRIMNHKGYLISSSAHQQLVRAGTKAGPPNSQLRTFDCTYTQTGYYTQTVTYTQTGQQARAAKRRRSCSTF